MQVSIGLPSTIPGVPGDLLFAWAQQADAGPFASLGVIGRLVYPNYESLITLSAMAGVTRRLRLLTAALLAPLYNTGVLAKQAASLDALCGGRLTLGLGIGNRRDDYEAAPGSFGQRGRHFDEQLALLKRIWSGASLNERVGPIGPAPIQPGGPELLIGGRAEVALNRVARWASGYLSSETDVQRALAHYQRVEAFWKEEGRGGRPRFVGITYFGLGKGAEEHIQSYLRGYYAFRGPQAEAIVKAASSTPAMVKETLRIWADIGMDELLFWPCLASLDQVERLAQLVEG
ncbi:MAG TPA: LLM class flavin-dependent oxidoreductase [Ktedonobacteraceae bacterium]|jgi:alkanesulfonate monooxygenase SsuD/methylene tetrahydromethanopterin reductase-like flavin-dependent oxidoreductase (luciferase family)|nr:LLM class flavin-dependent oxidoreductase [Ktedonobacteraceae bacterium]